MRTFVVHRVLQFLPVLGLSTIAVWSLIYAVPGSPVLAILGENATAGQIAATQRRLGLDQSILQQYWTWLENALRFDFGESIISGQPVSDQLLSRVPATIQLAVLSMLLGLLIAFPIGIVAAVRPQSWAGRIIKFYEAAALAIPTFWLGILLLLAFSIIYPWFPGFSDYVPFWRDPVGMLRNTFLPAFALAIYISGIVSRFLTASLVETLGRDYVRTARAKGVPERRVVLSHALRNALLPTVTVVGLMLGHFLGGTIVTEVVFNYPGLGRLIYSAVIARDYPIVQGAVLFVIMIFLVLNLIVDVLYAYLDPRIRLG